MLGKIKKGHKIKTKNTNMNQEEKNVKIAEAEKALEEAKAIIVE
jgi:hypothetical protein